MLIIIALKISCFFFSSIVKDFTHLWASYLVFDLFSCKNNLNFYLERKSVDAEELTTSTQIKSYRRVNNIHADQILPLSCRATTADAKQRAAKSLRD